MHWLRSGAMQRHFEESVVLQDWWELRVPPHSLGLFCMQKRMLLLVSCFISARTLHLHEKFLINFWLYFCIFHLPRSCPIKTLHLRCTNAVSCSRVECASMCACSWPRDPTAKNHYKRLSIKSRDMTPCLIFTWEVQTGPRVVCSQHISYWLDLQSTKTQFALHCCFYVTSSFDPPPAPPPPILQSCSSFPFPQKENLS